jgi:hypothetical protein
MAAIRLGRDVVRPLLDGGLMAISDWTRRVIIAAGGIVATACTYNVNRSALAPHATPVVHSGQPVDGVVELSAGVSSAAHFRNPTVGNDEAAVEIPGTQIRGDGRLKVGDYLALGFLFESGLDATAHKPRRSQADVDNGNVNGFGVTSEVSIPTSDPRLRVGVALEMIVWSVPWVEWRTCADPICGDDPFTYEDKGTDLTSTWAFGVIPSWKAGALTLFGGATLRQHPTIIQKGTETDPFFDDEGDVQAGPFNLIVSAGLDAELAGGAVRGSVIVYQDLTADPVQYGPGVGAFLTVPLGRKPAQAAASAPTVTPTPTY